MSPDDPSFDLVVPFVACVSNGGTFDDDAYAAGFEAGLLWGRLEDPIEEDIEFDCYVRTPNVNQIDLVAMHFGWRTSSEPWDEHPDEWTRMTFTKEGL